MGVKSSVSVAVIASVLMIGGAAAQEAQQKPEVQTGTQVGVTQSPEVLREIRAAVRELREASVMLLNQKEEGSARDKAVESALNAILSAQQAMAVLPAEYRIEDRKTREAKDWPMAAARLDRATQALERALEQVEKTDDKQRDKAVSALNKAMDETRNALMAMPDWQLGTTGAPTETGTTAPR